MKRKKEMNYHALFVSGIAFMGAGIVFFTSVNVGVGAGLLGMGMVFMIIGGRNKNKWRR